MATTHRQAAHPATPLNCVCAPSPLPPPPPAPPQLRMVKEAVGPQAVRYVEARPPAAAAAAEAPEHQQDDEQQDDAADAAAAGDGDDQDGEEGAGGNPPAKRQRPAGAIPTQVQEQQLQRQQPLSAYVSCVHVCMYTHGCMPHLFQHSHAHAAS